jgi:1,4-dihydroxy-6-naphthoate synthase
METLTLGYSPCPNDTFIFYALVHGKLQTGGLACREVLEDVESLNRMAREGQLDVTKLSYGAFPALRGTYCLIRSGGALGRGCGPLVVAREPCTMEDLKGRTIAIPGENTTAFLLLRLYDPSLGERALPMPFHDIMEAVRKGEAEAGLIIHEGRFTYQDYGLAEVEDLGRWWERETGALIPLGCIAARRGLGEEVVRKTESLVRESVLYALSRPDEPVRYIRDHAQELDDEVIRQHIALYVNDYAVDMGEEGEQAVRTLFSMAEERGIVEKSSLPLFFA